jgi:hypothetical protein
MSNDKVQMTNEIQISNIKKSYFDEFVKSPKGLFSVIPAQAGIQGFL